MIARIRPEATKITTQERLAQAVGVKISFHDIIASMSGALHDTASGPELRRTSIPRGKTEAATR